MNWCFIVDSFAGKHVYEICGSEESFIPKFERHMSSGKESKAYFNNMPMFSFCRAILLMCMRARDMVRDALCLKEGV
jgi:orotate phosphoribosyltransferase